MDDTDTFIRIFGDHPRRSNASDRLRLRDAAVIADLRARTSRRLARMRDGDWSIDFTPIRTDVQTESSMFDAVLTSPTFGTRRVPFRIARARIEVGEHPLQTASRGDPRAIERALGEVLAVPNGGGATVEIVDVEIVEVLIAT